MNQGQRRVFPPFLLALVLAFFVQPAFSGVAHWQAEGKVIAVKEISPWVYVLLRVHEANDPGTANPDRAEEIVFICAERGQPGFVARCRSLRPNERVRVSGTILGLYDPPPDELHTTLLFAHALEFLNP